MRSALLLVADDDMLDLLSNDIWISGLVADWLPTAVRHMFWYCGRR